MLNDRKITLNMRPGHVPFRHREEFRTTLEGKYPWLRLCNGHWKIQQLWTNYFHKWKGRVTTTPGSNPADRTVISIPTESDENSDPFEAVIEIPTSSDEGSAGSKRGRPDEIDTSPSKKHKGKGKEVARPTVPSQPRKHRKQKAKANIAKVSLFRDPS